MIVNLHEQEKSPVHSDTTCYNQRRNIWKAYVTRSWNFKEQGITM